MPHPYAFLCGVTQIAQMTQISFYFFTFLLLKVPEKLAGLKIKSQLCAIDLKTDGYEVLRS